MKRPGEYQLDEPDIVRFSTEFQSALDEFQRTYGFPGATASYVLKDRTTFVAASGHADVEEGRPMTVQSRMLAASIGKSFVGAAAVALAQESVLDLDAPLSRWLGYRTWFGRLPNHDAITLRHLLTHRSGLPDHVHLDSFKAAVSRKWREKGNPFSPEELIEFVLDRPPLFEGGLQAVPISPDDPNAHYGLGVGIYRSSPFGPSYGHGGWIPGYSSSLRHYADHGVTVAFQINTDIGIVDDTTTVVTEMEKRLAQIAIAANNSMHTDGNSATLHSRQ